MKLRKEKEFMIEDNDRNRIYREEEPDDIRFLFRDMPREKAPDDFVGNMMKMINIEAEKRKRKERIADRCMIMFSIFLVIGAIIYLYLSGSLKMNLDSLRPENFAMNMPVMIIIAAFILYLTDTLIRLHFKEKNHGNE